MEVLGRYSHHSEQGEHVERLFEIVLLQPNSVKTRTIRQIQKRLRPDEVDQLVTDYTEGAKLADVALKFMINKSTASKLLESRGVTRRYRKLSQIERPKLVDLYQSGQSLAKIGDQFDVDPGTIRYHLLRSGVVLRDGHGRER